MKFEDLTPELFVTRSQTGRGNRTNSFGDAVAERSAALSDVAVFDVSDRVQIEIAGRDRQTFLHNFCSNDIKKLQPDQGCEAFVTNIKGKVVGHIFVFAEMEALWLESVAGSAATLLPHLERYVITEDVRMVDRSAEFSELLLVGPQAALTLESLGCTLGALARYGNLTAVDATSLWRSVRRVDWFESPTFLISVPVARHVEAWQRMVEAGCCPAGTDAFEALRITAGFPLYGQDITEDHLAQEVGRTALAISFTKGCYLGQEPIARIDAMGHVNRLLCRLEFSSGPLPVTGMAVLDKPSADGKPIGQITSAAWSLQQRDNDKPAALAYLRSGFTTPGTNVFAAGPDGPVPGVVR